MDIENRRARIMIVDDHPVVRHGMTYMINQLPDMEMVFQAENAGEAIDGVKNQAVDLAMLDITLKKGSGLDLVSDLLKLKPTLKVLVMSMHDEHQYAHRALQNGAHGYVMKDMPSEEIIGAIRHVLRGGTYLSESAKNELVAQAITRPDGKLVDPVRLLTNREVEILRLIGSACTTDEMAQTLGISIKTVEVHRMHIKAKLGTKTVAELVRFAVHWVDANP